MTTTKTIDVENLTVQAQDLPKLNWNDAVKACAALGEGWRLPTQDELNVMYQKKDAIGGFCQEPLAGYWSSTPHGTILSNGEDDGRRWYQMFNNGDKYNEPLEAMQRARAVKSKD